MRQKAPCRLWSHLGPGPQSAASSITPQTPPRASHSRSGHNAAVMSARKQKRSGERRLCFLPLSLQFEPALRWLNPRGRCLPLALVTLDPVKTLSIVSDKETLHPTSRLPSLDWSFLLPSMAETVFTVFCQQRRGRRDFPSHGALIECYFMF